jgi:hypothetical protein
MRVRLEIKAVDLLDRTVDLVYRETLPEQVLVEQDATLETSEKA